MEAIAVNCFICGKKPKNPDLKLLQLELCRTCKKLFLPGDKSMSVYRSQSGKNFYKPDPKRAKAYRGHIISITPPYPARGLKDCPECDGGKIAENNRVVNCPTCEGTGKQMTEKIEIRYEIDRPSKESVTSQVREFVTNSLFAGGIIWGNELSPSTWFKRLSTLYATDKESELETADPWTDLGNGELPELVLLVDNYKVFGVRLYEGEQDRIHGVGIPANGLPLASKGPPSHETGPAPAQTPKPRLKPATGLKTQAVATAEEPDEEVPF